MAVDDDPPCLLCRHYKVTWMPKTPHGCLFFGFRTRGLPSVKVRIASGMRCESFARRTSAASTPRPPDKNRRVDVTK